MPFHLIKEDYLTRQEVKGIPYHWGKETTLEEGANCFTLSNYVLFRTTGKILIPPKDYYLTYPSDNKLPPEYVREVCYSRLGEQDNPNLEKENCLVLLKFGEKYGVGASFKEKGQDEIFISLTGSYGSAKSSVHSIRAIRRNEPVFWSIANNPEAVEVETYLGRKRNGKPI